MSNGISIYVRLESSYTFFFKFKCFTVGPELLLNVQKFVPIWPKIVRSDFFQSLDILHPKEKKNIKFSEK